MKFKLEVAEVGNVGLRLTVTTADGTYRRESSSPLFQVGRGEGRAEALKQKRADWVAREACWLMDNILRREKYLKENPSEPILPKLLATLREKGYDVD